MSEKNGKAFFFKALVANPFIVNGAAVPFEILDRNMGVIALDSANPRDATLIPALRGAAKAHRGGISEITEAQYGEKKTQLPYSGPYKYEHEQPLKVLPQQNSVSVASQQAAAGGNVVTPAAKAAIQAAVAEAVAAATSKKTEGAVVAGKPDEPFRPATKRIEPKEQKPPE